MIRLIEGFETFGQTLGAAPAGLEKKYNVVANAALIDIEEGRHGGFSAEFNGTGCTVLTFSLTTNSTLIVGAGVKFAAFPFSTTTLLSLFDGVTQGVNVRVRSDGEFEVYRAGVLLGTTTGASVGLGIWSYVEIKVLTHASAGTVELRVNGSAKLTLSGVNTKAGSNDFHDAVQFRGVTATSPHWDDVYIADGSGSANNDFLGNQKVTPIYPNAEGTTNDFTPSAGIDNSAMVSENPADDDSTYVESATIDHKDLYGFQAASLDNIKAVQINVDARETDAGALEVIIVARSGVTESDGDSEPLSASYATLTRIVETDPATGLAFTQAGLNAAEFGVKVD